MGPEALRVAGLDKSLRRLGCTVVDRGNLSGPINPEAPRAGGYRHLAAGIVAAVDPHNLTLAADPYGFGKRNFGG